MPINGLGANQIPTEAQASVFVLKSGQAHGSTNLCLTKLVANTKYHLIQSNLSGYANNQLVKHEDLINRPTAWRGINQSCVVEDTTALSSFNFMVIKYKWANGAGADFDTFTGIINSGTILDTNWVGYGQGQPSIPDATTIDLAYVYWAGDNTSQAAGSEAVLINFSKITTDFPSLTQIITKMAGAWYASILSGNIDIEIKTYLGGTMSKSGYDIINTGGTLVQTVNFSKNIPIRSTTANINDATGIGFITYTKSSTTGQIIITY